MTLLSAIAIKRFVVGERIELQTLEPPNAHKTIFRLRDLLADVPRPDLCPAASVTPAASGQEHGEVAGSTGTEAKTGATL